MDLLYIIFLAVAISLDGFFVGFTYGLRKIKVSLIPLLIISAVSGIVIMLAMILGTTLGGLILPETAEVIGSIILIGVGIMVFYETYKSLVVEKEVKEGYSVIYADEDQKEPQELFSWNIKPLGIIINILRKPIKADFDSSGSISNYEAVFLGLALALDALGAGFGAALSGFSPLLIPLIVGLTKFIFLYMGNLASSSCKQLLNTKLAYLSGFILILLGVIKLI